MEWAISVCMIFALFIVEWIDASIFILGSLLIVMFYIYSKLIKLILRRDNDGN